MLLTLLVTMPLAAQEELDFSPQREYLESTQAQRTIKESKWKKAVKGLDYTPPKVKKRRARNNNGNRPTGNARTALIVFAVLLIAVVIALIIGASSGYLKSKPKQLKTMRVSIEDIEENLFENDLQLLLLEAINKGQYNLAIRLYFLEILKELALQKKIKWKKEKTNRIYFYELHNSGFSEQFDRLCLQFDRIRYGGISLDKQDFSILEPGFKTFLANLQKTKA